MAILQKPSLGRLRKMYKVATIHSGWATIFRSNRRNFDSKALQVLRKNNAKGMIKELRAFIDKAEKDLT